MKNKPWPLLLLVAACLILGSGCANNENRQDEAAMDAPAATVLPTQTAQPEPDEYTEFAAEHTFISDLPDEDLQKPKRAIASLEDYIYALDYLAFYRIGDKIWFDVAPELAEEIYNPYTIHQKAYEMADLADVYACQMDDAYYSSLGVIGVKYSMSRDIASEPPAEISDTPILPSFDYVNHERTEYPLPIDEGEKQEVSCENGEQLYYLVMNGYRPLPKTGSTAEQLYEEAKKVVFSCTSPDQSDFQKIRSVYDWLTTEVRYDGATAYSLETYLVKEQAYYLEGVFINRCAVCDGKSKAYALMLNMIGIPCYRTTGVNEGGDHAWNMVRLDGTWYISCSTYGQKNMSDSIGRIVPNYSMLLVSRKTPYEWYPAQKHPDIEEQLSETPYDYYGQISADEGLDLKIEDGAGFKKLLDDAQQQCPEGEYKIEFIYTGSERELFEPEMIAILEERGGYNAVEIRCEAGCAYQIFKLLN